MKKVLPLFVLVAGLVVVPGCVEEKNEFIINPDGSGKVKHHVLFSPVQLNQGGEQASKQEQLKQMAKKEISKSNGVDAWKNVSYEVKDDGTLSFTGIAYFSDISELDFHSQGLDGPINTISVSENNDGTVTFELTSDDEETQQPQESTDADLSEEEIQKKIEKTRKKFKQMKSMLSLEDIQISHIYNLPAPVQSSTNVKWDSPKRGGVFISGKDLVKAMDTMMSSDKMMRKLVKQGDGMKEPPSNMGTFNEMVFGEKGPVQFTISGEGRPQFDYEQEVQQAREETKQLKSELGIETGGSTAGENEPTAGSGSDPDVDGGKFGVARKNKTTMKANWGIAFYNQEKNRLILGFYPKTPNKSLLQSIKDKRQLAYVPDLNERAIQIAMTLKEGARLSQEAVERYSTKFMNFGDDPMNLGRGGASVDKAQIKLDGTLEQGGRVKGMFKATHHFDLGDADDTYTWNLTFDLPIQ